MTLYKLKIKELRIQKKLTQNEVSKLTGISRNYISELENLKHDTTIEVLMMLSKGLKVRPDMLIEMKEDDLKLFSLSDRTDLKEKIITLITKENPTATNEFIKTLLEEIERDLDKKEVANND